MPSCGVGVAGAAADDAEGAKRGYELDMVVAERVLFDRQCSAQALLGGVEVAAARVDGAEVRECHPDLVVVGPERSLEHRQRAFEQFGRLVVAAERVEDGGQCGAIGGGVGMVGAEAGLADRHRSASGLFAVGGAPGGVREAADVVQHRCDLGVLGAQPRDEHGVRAFIERGGLRKAPVYLSTTPRSLQTLAVARSSGGNARSASARRPPVAPFGAVQVTGLATLSAEALVDGRPNGPRRLQEQRHRSPQRHVSPRALDSVVEEQRLVVIRTLPRSRMRRG